MSKRYPRRLLAAALVGTRTRLGDRWGGYTLAGPLIFGSAAGLLLSGSDSVSGESVGLALLSGLAGVAAWIGLVFLWSVIVAPSELDASLREDRDRLDAALSRLASVRFRLTPRSQFEIGQIPASASLWVENVDEGEARNCRGRLIGLTYLGGPRRATLDVPLSWVHPDHPDDPTRKTFHHGAELEVAVKGTPNYMIPAGATRRTIFDPRTVQIARDANSILGIEIAPEGAVPTVGWFRLRWWSFVQIKQDDGSVVHYDTRGDQIEFEDADPQSSNPAISSQVHT